FFIARTVAAMLMGFCGSNNTTTTEESSDSGIVDLERDETIGVLPIASQIDELAVRTAQDELTAASLTSSRHLVHDHIDRVRDRGEVEVGLVPGVPRSPSRARCRDRDGRADRPNMNRCGLALGNEHPGCRSGRHPNMELHTIAVDVGLLVVVAVQRVGWSKG